MPLEVLPIEKALLLGKWDESISDGPVADFAKLVVNGDFRGAFTSPYVRKILAAFAPDNFDSPFNVLLGRTVHDEAQEEEILRVIIAVACLHAFVQANWTGPFLDVTSLDVFVLPQLVTVPTTPERLNLKALSELARNGEPAYHLCQHPAFLRVAQVLLDLEYRHCRSVPWWRLRTASVHLQVLDEPVPVPPEILTSAHALANSFSSDAELVGRLFTEEGLLEHRLSHNKSAADHFFYATGVTGLEYELTGALGKRTKYQESEISQLVLLAESRLHLDSDKPTTKGSDNPNDNAQRDNPPVPTTLPLLDDTLLERTQFTSSDPNASSSRLAHLDVTSQPPLHPLDQCIVLSLCLNVKNTSPADGLTNEQMSPYIERVISHPRNWSVHTMALLLRSRLEAARTRTVERSTLQLQALIDQMPTGDSKLAERLFYFHSIPLPSKWEMEKELALRFLSLGVVRSALDIFERLEMWEEAVKCWQALEREDKAIAVVRDLLEGRKEEADAVVSRRKVTTSQRRREYDTAREAKLWCLLGDLERDQAAEHYERAWRVSKETSGRAMRSLGGYHFAQGEYAKAIACLKRAVAINPLLSRSWFILGCAYVREENWEGGREAFSRCVAIDSEDGESWNNLASMYLRLSEVETTSEEKSHENGDPSSCADGPTKSVSFSNKLLAFEALKQGLKSSFNNWRMWNNYMLVAVDVGQLSEACRALSRVVEETSAKAGAQSVDEDVLDRLVDASVRTRADHAASSGPDEGRSLLPRVTDLLERVILPRVSSARIFRAYGRLLAWESRWDEAIKAYFDGYRCSTAGTLEKGSADIEQWRRAVAEVTEMVDVLKRLGPLVEGYQWPLQARSIVRSLMARTKEFEDEPEWGTLLDLKEAFT